MPPPRRSLTSRQRSRTRSGSGISAADRSALGELDRVLAVQRALEARNLPAVRMQMHLGHIETDRGPLPFLALEPFHLNFTPTANREHGSFATYAGDTLPSSEQEAWIRAFQAGWSAEQAVPVVCTSRASVRFHQRGSRCDVVLATDGAPGWSTSTGPAGLPASEVSPFQELVQRTGGLIVTFGDDQIAPPAFWVSQLVVTSESPPRGLTAGIQSLAVRALGVTAAVPSRPSAGSASAAPRKKPLNTAENSSGEGSFPATFPPDRPYSPQETTPSSPQKTLRRIRHPRPNSEIDWLLAAAQALERSGASPLTVRTYSKDWTLFRRWLAEKTEGTVVWAQLAALDYLAYRQHLVQVQRLRPATVNHRIQALRWLTRWAVREGRIETDPAAELRALPVPRRRQPLALTDAEIHALARAAGATRPSLAARNSAVVQLLVQTGLRVGELVRLHVADITLHDRSGHVRVRLGKREKEREVPLNATARRALRLYLDTRPRIGKEAPLFTTSSAAPLSERSVQALVQSLARRARIIRLRVTPHSFRHTFARAYLEQNPGKLVDLAHLLGHDSLDTTAIYTQPSSEALAEDLERSRLNVYG